MSDRLDLDGAARLLGTPRATLERWVRQGLLRPAASPFGGVAFARAELEAWARRRELRLAERERAPSAILPLMIVGVLALLVTRRIDRWSMYTRELAEQGELLRPGTDRRILADVKVIESLDADVTPVPEDLTLADFTRVVKSSRRNHFPVLGGDGETLVGMLDLATVRELLLDPELARVTLVGTMMQPDPPAVDASATLAQALVRFEEAGSWVLPVVGKGRRFVGLLSRSTLFDVYRQELSVQTDA